jgi:predicted unusual protein kinase regulating ubiquinone biosynthesis (AarF/ABC1/UbiB family)
MQKIGEDLFAIAIDQPFRFPATFTFVLRAFSTLEGIGKTLNPAYNFSEVATPYAQELLQLQDVNQQGFIIEQLQQQATEVRWQTAVVLLTASCQTPVLRSGIFSLGKLLLCCFNACL